MRHYISRRGVLTTALAGGVAACSPAKTGSAYTSNTQKADGMFSHGIASGDPLADSVIIWTRATPENPQISSLDVAWEISKDPNFSDIKAANIATTHKALNWTVKVDVTGLEAGQNYYYRFKVGTTLSPVGQTRTLPTGQVKQLRFAIVSCSNWQQGYFNVYDHIVRQNDFDALIHLGDYFYEYGAEQVLGTPLAEMGRLHEPRHEIITLEDYRLRHAQYRTDPSLQAVTAKMPLIAIWDDHESSNDSWVTGAENHDESEGTWEDRKQAALRAYYEWMPVRNPTPGRAREALFRAFEWGDLLTLATLETRLLARDAPIVIDDYFEMLRTPGGLEKFNSQILNDPVRDMLGTVQLDFLTQTLASSKANGKTWRVLANQVVMGKVQTPDLTPHVDENAIRAIEPHWSGIRNFVELSKFGLPVYPDSWDGYPAARDKLYASLKAQDVTDIFVVTGDAHEFWINDLISDTDEKMGVEVGTTSVTSETLEAFLGDSAEDYALLMTQSNPDVRYYNPLYQGYTDITFNMNKATVRLIAVDNVMSENYSAFETAKFTVKPGKNSLKFSNPSGLNLKQLALFNGLG